MRYGNRLPREQPVVYAPLLEVSVQGQIRWDPVQPDLVLGLEAGSPDCNRGGWILMILEMPSDSSYSVIPLGKHLFA